jgi:hypothetical protein
MLWRQNSEDGITAVPVFFAIFAKFANFAKFAPV